MSPVAAPNGKARGPALIPTGRKALRIGLENGTRFADVTVPGDLSEEELLVLIGALATTALPALREPASRIVVPT